jgi:hypothetical protein
VRKRTRRDVKKGQCEVEDNDNKYGKMEKMESRTRREEVNGK